MNKIEWDTENGVLDENDLWKLFSDHPNTAAETIMFYSQLKPLLRKMRFKDETRLYHVYHHPGGFPDPPVGARFRATVTQRNLRRVAAAIAGRGNNDAAIQYLGPKLGNASE
ncbi:hypothetical protein PEL8287_03704 [Roseovarius litorisediminis]|uniref:Uncharacterized protein n=1 Tax=Roseovarius litorisediminis TaxID=1312363 RepID=A0A1Y5TLD7_9RHOB|nr:hypothetical protein [Roseovarius litorisediminis]SLN66748.1 hypothetical protein PEL8287_03704 [Roseovarius litorisediminis]